MRIKRCLLVFTVAFWAVSCGGNDSPTGPGNLPPELPPECEPIVGNTPPVIAVQPDTAVSVGDTLYLTARATDADADALRYSCIVLLRWIELRTWVFPQTYMDSTNGGFWFAPGPRDVPGRYVSFIVDDGRCAQDTTQFFVRVDGASR